jgi:hypothetical protein
MRKYKIIFWIESNDVATDCEHIIEGRTIMHALKNFYKLNLRIKRVTDINELPYKHEAT